MDSGAMSVTTCLEMKKQMLPAGALTTQTEPSAMPIDPFLKAQVYTLVYES